MSFLKIFTILVVILYISKYGNTKSCGTQLKNLASEYRILGGTDAEKGAWPWAVEVIEMEGTLMHKRCGGALISPQWVLTSAFCIFMSEGLKYKLYQNLQVAVGYHNLNEKDKGSITLHVSKIILHEHFGFVQNNNTDWHDLLWHLANDIALLKLNLPMNVEENESVNTICLPKKDDFSYKDQRCFLAGWGFLNDAGENTMDLQEAELSYIESTECEEKYADNPRIQINKDFFCAGTEEKGGCLGDGGSPYVCLLEDTWYLVGVVSHRRLCHKKEQPTVLANVASYIDWIEKKTRQFSCGTKLLKNEPNPEPQFRILGGTDAEKGAWPWAVEVQDNFEGRIFHHCGGVLLDDEWVLTNANCLALMKGKNHEHDIIQDISVAVGYRDLNKTEDGTLRVPVSKIIVHKDFTMEPSVLHDIALVKLERPLEADTSNLINPICLPSKTADFSTAKCFMVGWGHLNPDYEKTSILQEVELPFVDQEKCKEYYASHEHKTITEDHFCAGTDEKGFCGGDQGTPFVCEDDGKWYLVGLTSGSGKYCADEEDPTIFLRIQSYLDWIDEVRDKNKCGIRTAVSPESEGYRILGGKSTNRGEWPWVVAFRKFDYLLERLQLFCMGTLIESQWVLTAAHCFEKSKEITDVVAVVGSVYHNKIEEGGIEITILKVIQHKDYISVPRIKNDIALVKLKRPILYTYNKFINTACLPDQDIPYLTSKCFAVGWSSPIDLMPFDVLQEMEIIFVNTKTCNEFLEAKSEFAPPSEAPSVYCGAAKGSGCRGDSGGPMVCNVYGRWHILGVAVAAGNCATGTGIVYMSVRDYLSWINSVIYES